MKKKFLIVALVLSLIGGSMMVVAPAQFGAKASTYLPDEKPTKKKDTKKTTTATTPATTTTTTTTTTPAPKPAACPSKSNCTTPAGSCCKGKK